MLFGCAVEAAVVERAIAAASMVLYPTSVALTAPATVCTAGAATVALRLIEVSVGVVLTVVIERTIWQQARVVLGEVLEQSAAERAALSQVELVHRSLLSQWP